MALNQQSITNAAKRKALIAQHHVKDAEAELKEANEKLDKGIPAADQKTIVEVHRRTKVAERAVVEASEELEVLGELLESSAAGSAGTRSGEGMQSLMRTLRHSGKKRG